MLSPSRMLILFGIILLILGFILSGRTTGVPWFDSAIHKFFSWFTWLGKLPGDVIIERFGFTIHAPIASSIAVGIGITTVFWIFRKLF